MEPVRRLWQRLVELPPFIKGKIERLKARLLSEMLLTLVFLGTIVELGVLERVSELSVMGLVIKVAGLALMAVGYAVSRSRHYRLAILFPVVLASIEIFLRALYSETGSGFSSLIFLVVPVLIGSLFLSLRQTTILIVTLGMAMLVVPVLLIDNLVHSVLIRPFSNYFIMTSLILLLARQRQLVAMNRTVQLAESEDRYRSVVLALNEGIVVQGADGAIIEYNDSAARILGIPRDRMVGERCMIPGSDDIHEDGSPFGSDEQLAMVTLNSGEPCHEVIMGIRNRAGEREWISMNFQPLYRPGEDRPYAAVTSFTDITMHRREERNRLQSEKIKSLTLLARGLAHDFNNALSSIMLNVRAASLSIDNSQPLGLLNTVERSVTSASGITNQLLSFSRGNDPITTITYIQEVIRENSKFVLHDTKVTAQSNFPEDLWAVVVDTGQLAQVINNLVLNAVKAMPQGGRITFSASNYSVTAATEVYRLKPGKYVKVSIKDEGIGIAQENLDKIFDPFFTTHADGTGLGLSSCLNIMLKHNGWISAESEVGRGTTFTLYLPATTELPVKMKEAHPLLRGDARILLMDDDEAIRTGALAMFTGLGYNVVVVPEGESALKSYQTAMASDNPFDLVVLDLTVREGLGGEETMAKLLELDIGVTAIVSSGYADNPIMSKHADYGFKAALPKPFTPEKFGEVMKSVMDTRP